MNLLASVVVAASEGGLSPEEAAETKAAFAFMGSIGLLVVADLLIWLFALVHILKNENFKDSTTKALWVVVVLLTSGVGALIYLLFGRPKAAKQSISQ